MDGPSRDDAARRAAQPIEPRADDARAAPVSDLPRRRAPRHPGRTNPADKAPATDATDATDATEGIDGTLRSVAARARRCAGGSAGGSGLFGFRSRCGAGGTPVLPPWSGRSSGTAGPQPFAGVIAPFPAGREPLAGSVVDAAGPNQPGRRRWADRRVRWGEPGRLAPPRTKGAWFPRRSRPFRPLRPPASCHRRGHRRSRRYADDVLESTQVLMEGDRTGHMNRTRCGHATNAQTPRAGATNRRIGDKSSIDRPHLPAGRSALRGRTPPPTWFRIRRHRKRRNRQQIAKPRLSGPGMDGLTHRLPVKRGKSRPACRTNPGPSHLNHASYPARMWKP